MTRRGWIRFSFAAPLALVVAFDVYVLLFLASSSVSRGRTSSAVIVPEGFTVDHYRRAWSQAHLGHMAVNSLFIVTVSVALVLIASLTMAFAISRLVPQRRANTVLRGSVVWLLAVPPSVLIVPIFYVVNYLGLINSFAGLILVYGASVIPFGTFIMIRYFDDLPVELFEAAKLDGAGPLRQLVSIATPNTLPAVITVASLTALSLWNELLFGLLILQDPSKRTLTVGVSLLNSTFSNESSQQTLSAAMVISIIPPMVLFALTSRRLMVGLTAGAVK